MLCGVGLFLARSFALFPIQNLPIPFDVFRLFLLCLKSWLWFVFNSKSLFFDLRLSFTLFDPSSPLVDPRDALEPPKSEIKPFFPT